MMLKIKKIKDSTDEEIPQTGRKFKPNIYEVYTHRTRQ